ncbi:MAG: recombinase family protein, partial [Armatimonadetes bacterium]|nr:recombinase family protein [Armatimonadota bacterium]
CMSENIREGIRSRLARGRYLARPPFGWRWREVAEPDGSVRRGDAIEGGPEQAEWVKQMAEGFLSGWGTAKIARELNRLGVRTAKGKQWSAKGVAECLKTPVHCGLMKVGDEVIEGEHKGMRIYGRETWEAIMRRFRERKRLPGRTKGAVRALLAGIGRCGTCGRLLIIHHEPRRDADGRARLRYRCRGNQRRLL